MLPFQPLMVAMPPSVIVQLAKSPLLSQYDLTSVVMCATGAAPLKNETVVIFGKRFNNATVSDGKICSTLLFIFHHKIHFY